MIYEHVQGLYEEVSEIITAAHGIQAQRISPNDSPTEAMMLVRVALRQGQVLLRLAEHLFAHPEWLPELDRVLMVEGCPAFKIPLVEEFLASKGVR